MSPLTVSVFVTGVPSVISGYPVEFVRFFDAILLVVRLRSVARLYIFFVFFS